MEKLGYCAAYWHNRAQQSRAPRLKGIQIWEDKMTAYVIGDVNVKNPQTYQTYRSQVLATVEKYGGRFLVRGGEHEVLEGKWKPNRLVILEFPDMASLKNWYRSKEYAPLIKLRETASDGNIVAVAGG